VLDLPVMCIRLKCSLNKLLVVRKFTVILLDFIFVASPIKIILFPNKVNQHVRKPVREFRLSNERQGTAKSIACRITSVKQCAAAPTVLLLCTQDRS